MRVTRPTPERYGVFLARFFLPLERIPGPVLLFALLLFSEYWRTSALLRRSPAQQRQTENAENLYYCIYDGKIARVDFTLNGHEYTYEAAKLEGNFSQAEGDTVGSTVLNAEYGATLDCLSKRSALTAD